MTSWQDMTITKRRWVIYRTVMYIGRDKSHEDAILAKMRAVYHPEIKLGFLLRTLEEFERRGTMGSRIATIDGKPMRVWYPIDPMKKTVPASAQCQSLA